MYLSRVKISTDVFKKKKRKKRLNEKSGRTIPEIVSPWPKDGTDLLLCTGNKYVFVLNYCCHWPELLCL